MFIKGSRDWIYNYRIQKPYIYIFGSNERGNAKSKFGRVERLHQQARSHQDQVQQRSPLHSVLANAQLQTKNQASQKMPRPREISAYFY